MFHPSHPFLLGCHLGPMWAARRRRGQGFPTREASDFHLASTRRRSLNFQGGGGKVLLRSTLLQICSLHPSPINPFRSIPSSSIFPLQRASHSTSKSFCCHPFLPLRSTFCSALPPDSRRPMGRGKSPVSQLFFVIKPSLVVHRVAWCEF